MASLPYVTAPGNIEKALNGIVAASTPENVSQDFVKTVLKIPGGSGNQMTAYLRKIGFANEDGTPSDTYIKFRNSSTRGEAAAKALKKGYAPLYIRNEYMHKLNDKSLRGLIIEETGHSEDSNVINLVVSAINSLKKFADFDSIESNSDEVADETYETNQNEVPLHTSAKRHGLNLSYTINLNLPATSDISVFNAIFKSLKENILRDLDE
jgi:hypothetical protein